MFQKGFFKILVIAIMGVVVAAGVLIFINKYLAWPQEIPTAKEKITVLTPIPAPPAPSTSTQEAACVYQDGSCCQKQGVCNAVMVSCENELHANIKGCNEKCEAIFECVPDLSDWETYRNEKYGFEIKYPNHWTFSEYNVGRNIGISFESSKVAQEGCDIDAMGDADDNPFTCPGNSFGINIYNDFTRDKYINNFKGSKLIVSQTEDIMISGKKFTKIMFANYGSEYIIEDNGRLLIFSSNGGYVRTEQIILSTFRFLE